ncbi:MAG: hypothetical protein BGO05_18160 [Rhizobiales bacterium 63-7]|nr:MAG: hypothetical protein BGO05_18160 [Rhizobiales bacterium 63-7]
MRKKDVVLMATVTSFENLRYPTRSELRQFAELFAPLFKASSEEARRQAVAALSQCPNIPEAVALFIGSQPIGVAAPFLTCSQAISDQTLITIARSQGGAHAKAIARRDNLSPMVVDALVGIRQEMPGRGGAGLPAAPVAPPPAAAPQPQAVAPTVPVVSEEEVQRQKIHEREEQLRQELRNLVRHLDPPANDRLGLRSLDATQEALLVRFARTRDADHFATALADALSASRFLSERIMLDISGQQLATTLISLGLADEDGAFILSRLYPHLGEQAGRRTRAQILLSTLDPAECDARVEAWRRADSYTFRQEEAGRHPRPADQIPPVSNLKSIGRR